jgi:hypothetical protein
LYADHNLHLASSFLVHHVSKEMLRVIVGDGCTEASLVYVTERDGCNTGKRWVFSHI